MTGTQTRWASTRGQEAQKMTVAQILEAVTTPPLPIRFTAFDGSATGPEDAPFGLRLENPRGLSRLLTAPNELGAARAYISGDLTATGVHPANPYPAFRALAPMVTGLHAPSPRALREILTAVGTRGLVPPEPPVSEQLPAWRRALHGALPHSHEGDAETVTSHYDRSNEFYAHVLGPSMTYTCACFPHPGATLEEAQENKLRLVLDKLDLHPGDRLLDIGCGWGSMLVAAAKRGIRAIGVTLSEPQVEWANEWIAREGLSDLAEARVMDYRDVPERDFDAVCSLGMMEHVGVRHYDGYFRKMHSLLRPGGRLLNHQITRRDSRQGQHAGAFINRYIFPDGELAAPGVVMTHLGDSGLEVIHEENLRQHYAITLRHWCENLQENWDVCVGEAGRETALLWGLYMSGARLSFETNGIQIHQFLAVRPGLGAGWGPSAVLPVDEGASSEEDGHWYPLRQWWAA
ncbi:class I SAM-dependent methyltransferase [Schaalia naturae]|uniref:class I SAM-dependent methyltransferase n=1 Tax=Schaalia naturae TaxID=635203 RepID=UPI0036433B8B